MIRMIDLSGAERRHLHVSRSLHKLLNTFLLCSFQKVILHTVCVLTKDGGLGRGPLLRTPFASFPRLILREHPAMTCPPPVPFVRPTRETFLGTGK